MERDGLRHATSAQDMPHDDDNHYSTHTGSAVARVTKGRVFRCIPGRRWKVCDWYTELQDQCQEKHHYGHMERKNTERSRQARWTHPWDEQIPLEHPRTLWSPVEKHRRNIHPGRTQTVLQGSRRQTWTRSRVPHSLKHCELHHGLSANFQPTYHHLPEGNAIQHHHHTGVCPNIRLWRCRRLLRTTAGSPWPNSKERYPSGARRLECQDRRRCLWELDRHMWKILQHQIKWKRPKAPGICQLQRTYAGEHLWPTQSIQKSHVAQPKWKVPQPDRLHHAVFVTDNFQKSYFWMPGVWIFEGVQMVYPSTKTPTHVRKHLFE